MDEKKCQVHNDHIKERLVFILNPQELITLEIR